MRKRKEKHISFGSGLMSSSGVAHLIVRSEKKTWAVVFDEGGGRLAKRREGKRTCLLKRGGSDPSVVDKRNSIIVSSVLKGKRASTPYFPTKGGAPSRRPQNNPIRRDEGKKKKKVQAGEDERALARQFEGGKRKSEGQKNTEDEGGAAERFVRKGKRVIKRCGFIDSIGGGKGA